MNLILASQSPYRKNLVEKFGLNVKCQNPSINEDLLKTQLLEKSLSPLQLAEELSYQKALSVFDSLQNKSETLVLSGDQLVQFKNRILGKPSNFENAFLQLQELQGQTHELITAVTLFGPQEVIRHTEVIKMQMRALSKNEITHYLKLDQPYDCAGSYKIEQTGITLFSSIICDDFTAIQGLPLIWLGNKLKEYYREFFTNPTA